MNKNNYNFQSQSYSMLYWDLLHCGLELLYGYFLFVLIEHIFLDDGKETIKRNSLEWDLKLKFSETMVVLEWGEAAKSSRYREKCNGFSHEIFILLRNQKAQYDQ